MWGRKCGGFLQFYGSPIAPTLEGTRFTARLLVRIILSLGHQHAGGFPRTIYRVSIALADLLVPVIDHDMTLTHRGIYRKKSDVLSAYA